MIPLSSHRRFTGVVQLFVRWTGMVFLIACGWLLMDSLWLRYPFIRSGSRCTIDAKRDRMVRSPMFTTASSKAARLLVCGNSHALCAFVPEQFDRLSLGKVYSQNLGLPGEKEFLTLLESAIESGNVPTHVFLMIPWSTDQFSPNIWHWVKSDSAWADRLFPFRSLPRDFLSFCLSARSHGGIKGFYRYQQTTADKMIAERGYHFIARASRFPDHRLPDDFTTVIDDERIIGERLVECKGPAFERLKQLSEIHDFRVYFIPHCVREKNLGEPPPTNPKTVEALRPFTRFRSLGPDYKRYPNRLFADELHVNPEGAAVFTEYLWGLTHQEFEPQT
ncbi:hypothetical protein K2X85_13585 [bacterium]|nr:hypothetical protein [bacterium]